MIGIIFHHQMGIFLSLFIWTIYTLVLCINHKKFKKLKLRLFNSFLFALYIGLVIGVTLFPIAFTKHELNISPVINLDILSIFDYGFSKWAMINIFGNILLLMPLPTLAYMNGFKCFKKFKCLLLGSFLISLSIELLQYLESYLNLYFLPRATDILDLILNVLGAVIGYFVLILLMKISFFKNNLTLKK